MPNAFIFHGTSGYPEENWFPWLKKKLQARGYNVIIPQFPTPENQTPEAWIQVFDQYKNFYTPDTIVFGHSLGGTFLLRLLEKSPIKIKAAYFIATPIGILPIKNYETDKPFLKKPFNWGKIKTKAERFIVFHSDNDPFVSLENGKNLAQNLNTDLTFIPKAGHFNKSAGYTKFDSLLPYIQVI